MLIAKKKAPLKEVLICAITKKAYAFEVVTECFIVRVLSVCCLYSKDTLKNVKINHTFAYDYSWSILEQR